MSGDAVRQLVELLKDSGATVQFGLRAQGHLQKVRAMLADGASWEAIGDAIGWHGPTAQKHFQWEEFADAVLTAERARLREKVEAMLKRDIRPPIAKDGFDLAIRDVLEILGEP